MSIHAQLSELAHSVSALEAKLAAYERRYSAPLMPIEELSAVVRETRRNQCLSQRALADLADVSQATVVGLETQARTPQLDGLVRILSALGLTLYVGGQS